MGLFTKIAARITEEKAAWDATKDGARRRERRMDREHAQRRAAQLARETSGTCTQKGCTRRPERGYGGLCKPCGSAVFL